MATKVTKDAVLDAVLAAPRPADAARALGMPGKTFRDVLRSRFGVYVSTDPTLWNERVKRFAYAHVRARGNTAFQATIKQAWIDGDSVPPTIAAPATSTDAPATDAPADAPA